MTTSRRFCISTTVLCLFDNLNLSLINKRKQESEGIRGKPDAQRMIKGEDFPLIPNLTALSYLNLEQAKLIPHKVFPDRIGMISLNALDPEIVYPISKFLP